MALLLPFGEGVLTGFLRAIFDYLENSVDAVTMRVLGLLAVVAEGVLLYLGVYVV